MNVKHDRLGENRPKTVDHLKNRSGGFCRHQCELIIGSWSTGGGLTFGLADWIEAHSGSRREPYELVRTSHISSAQRLRRGE